MARSFAVAPLRLVWVDDAVYVRLKMILEAAFRKRRSQSLEQRLLADFYSDVGFHLSVELSCEECLVQLVSLYRVYGSALRGATKFFDLEVEASEYLGRLPSPDQDSGDCNHDPE